MHLRHVWILGLVLGMAFSGAGPLHSTEPGARPPNVLVILTDDQGWGDLSLHGNRNLSTPHLDGLAKQGASFDRFFVSPVCSPTRAEFLTGRYHPRGGVHSTSAGGERLDLDESTIAQSFQDAGYATAAFGKWHNGMQYPYHPTARGFDLFYGFCSGHWGDYFNPVLEYNGRLVGGEGYLTDDFTDQALDFIRRNRSRPFFCYLAYNTPHSPMQVPDPYWDRFKDKNLVMHHRDPDKEDNAHTRAALAMCENIDWNVGRLLQQLDVLDLARETIVVFFCDNGPNGFRWNGGMKGRKGWTDEGGVRSPLFIRWPGRIPAGRNITQISAAIDLLPTLVDLAGIPRREGGPLDGRSLKPLLTEDQPAWEERLLFSHWNNRVSVRSQRYRLDHEGRLFDMLRDPGQTEDVSQLQSEEAARLKEASAHWRSTVLAELTSVADGDAAMTRPFPVGHPDFDLTQLPARDAQIRGGIKWSNRFPNCSYLTNWCTTEDEIAWDTEVLQDGRFLVEIYYACPEKDVGSVLELSCGESRLTGLVAPPHDPPLRGMEHDRVPRAESYIKDFRPLRLGVIELRKGRSRMVLKALEIPGHQAMEFRLLMLTRVKG